MDGAERLDPAPPEKGPRLEATGRQGPGMFGFADRDQLKDEVKRRLMKPEPYDVCMYYKKTGFWQKIARHPAFENVTLAVIAINAIWMWIDTDYNGGTTPWDTHAVLLVGDHLFCVYFTFEWFARYQAFERKCDGLKDGWFKFDSLLVLLMVGETWVLFVILQFMGGGEGGLPFDASMLRLLRLARLSRMMRMLKVLRSMPELLTLIKGMGRAMKSVVYVMMLLFMLLYVFAIAMVQLLKDTDAGTTYFPNIHSAIWTLFCGGTLLDGVGGVVDDLGADSTLAAAFFLCFIALAALMVMNMLIGVLCEVISAVAEYEKEQLLLSYIKQKMEQVLHSIDENGDGTISRAEFFSIVADREAIAALQECDVDPLQLIEFTDQIFEEAGDCGCEDDSEASEASAELSFESFMDVILRYRGTNMATVSDMMDYRKFLIGYIDRRLKHQSDEIFQMLQLELAKRGFGPVPHIHRKHGQHGHHGPHGPTRSGPVEGPCITASWDSSIHREPTLQQPDEEKEPSSCAAVAGMRAAATDSDFHSEHPGLAPLQPTMPTRPASGPSGQRPPSGLRIYSVADSYTPAEEKPARKVFHEEPSASVAPAFGFMPPPLAACSPSGSYPAAPAKSGLAVAAGFASTRAHGLSPSQGSDSASSFPCAGQELLARIRQLSEANRRKILALSEASLSDIASSDDSDSVLSETPVSSMLEAQYRHGASAPPQSQ